MGRRKRELLEMRKSDDWNNDYRIKLRGSENHIKINHQFDKKVRVGNKTFKLVKTKKINEKERIGKEIDGFLKEVFA